MNAAPSLRPVLLAATSDLPAKGEADGAPEWVHLLPSAKGAITTQDARGPYQVADAASLIAASMQAAGKLPIDENHATDLAAPQGLPAPARGWIVELQARDDGIWGRVEWTDEGRKLVSGRAYRALSPVIVHDSAKRILAILRASLVNRPNLTGLTALNHTEETTMSFKATLAAKLGLQADASEEQILAAAHKAPDPAATTALQSQIAEIGTALGVEGGDPAAIVAAAKAAKTATPDTIKALQAELTTVTGQLKAMKDASAKAAAEGAVDAAIRAGTVGVKPLRDHYIARHMVDPAAVEKELAALPKLRASGAIETPPPAAKDGTVSLNAAQREACKALGLDPAKYAETLKAEKEEAL